MLIYLASPYSKYPQGRQTAFELVCKKAAQLMLNGYEVFCPIAHSHPIEELGMSDAMPMPGDFWLKQDFAVLKNCDELWVYMMEGWADSYGVRREIMFAKEHGIPIKHLDFVDTEGFGL